MAAAAEKVSSVKVDNMEDSSTIAAKCDPARTTLKRELIFTIIQHVSISSLGLQ